MESMMGILLEVVPALLPLIFVLALLYCLRLAARFVRAVERIADRTDSTSLEKTLTRKDEPR
jgi:hypothetical protein